MQDVELYSDGACIGNPGPGGYGSVVRTPRGERELSGGFRKTTNNRMEILGALAALRALDVPSRGTLFTDSLYVVKTIDKGWALSWRAKNWMRTKTERASNADLWAQVLELVERHEVKFRWVRGHAGHRENERCDALANTAARSKPAAIDEGYERELARASRGGLFDG